MFYDIFISLCAEKGKKPSDISKELGIGKSTISMWKKQKSIPNAVTLMQLAEYFNVTPAYLAGNTMAKTPLYFEKETLRSKTDIKKASGEKPEGIVEDEDNDIVLFNREARKMTPEQRKKLLEMAKIMFGEAYNDESHK